MSEAKFTPGPWLICEDPPRGDDKGGYRIDAKHTEQLAYVWNETVRYGGGPFGAKEGEANARLIAAAPDLLQVLERCESRLATAVEKHFTAYTGDKELLADIRAAIAKAKGEQ